MLISVALDPRALKGRSTAEIQILRGVLHGYGVLGCSRGEILEVLRAIGTSNQQESKKWEVLLQRLPSTSDRIDKKEWDPSERDDKRALDDMDTMWIPEDATFTDWLLSRKLPPSSKEFVVRPKSPRVDVVAFESLHDASMIEALRDKQGAPLSMDNPRSDLWGRVKPLLTRARQLYLLDVFLFGSKDSDRVQMGPALEWFCSEIGKLDWDTNLALNLCGETHPHWKAEDFESLTEKAWNLSNGCLRELNVIPVPHLVAKSVLHGRGFRFTFSQNSNQHSRWLTPDYSFNALDREPIAKLNTPSYIPVVSRTSLEMACAEEQNCRSAAENPKLGGLGIFTRSRDA